MLITEITCRYALWTTEPAGSLIFNVFFVGKYNFIITLSVLLAGKINLEKKKKKFNQSRHTGAFPHCATVWQ